MLAYVDVDLGPSSCCVPGRGHFLRNHRRAAALSGVDLTLGLSRTTLATYFPAFIIAGAMCLVAAAIVLLIGRKRRESEYRGNSLSLNPWWGGEEPRMPI